MKTVGLFFLSFCITSSALAARTWQRFEIPGAICGDGTPYYAFISKKDPQKVAIKVNGGNACWNYTTCFTRVSVTNMTSVLDISQSDDLWLSENKNLSPVADYTLVFIPYCTGDVHVGDHEANYNGTIAHHRGRQNVGDALTFFRTQQNIHLEKATHVVFSGNSAGAMGVIYHLQNVDPYVNPAAMKTIVLDAPGLHFGNAFWNKFTDALVNDFAVALAAYDMPLDRNNGNISDLIPKMCKKFPSWNIATLQAQKDRTMSTEFGNLTPWQHQKMILGPNGIDQKTNDPSDNCASFLPDSFDHVLLSDAGKQKNVATSEEKESKTAIQFAQDAVNGKIQPNYK